MSLRARIILLFATALILTLAVVQLQDVLALDSDARMNDPESYSRPRAEWPNWRWRLRPGQADGRAADRLRFLASLYGRV